MGLGQICARYLEDAWDRVGALSMSRNHHHGDLLLGLKEITPLCAKNNGCASCSQGSARPPIALIGPHVSFLLPPLLLPKHVSVSFVGLVLPFSVSFCPALWSSISVSVFLWLFPLNLCFLLPSVSPGLSPSVCVYTSLSLSIAPSLPFSAWVSLHLRLCVSLCPCPVSFSDSFSLFLWVPVHRSLAPSLPPTTHSFHLSLTLCLVLSLPGSLALSLPIAIFFLLFSVTPKSLCLAPFLLTYALCPDTPPALTAFGKG